MRLFAVFGNPIAHSKSPFLHNFVFEKLGIDAKYSRYKLEDSKDFRRIFMNLHLSGANITLPHKEGVFGACDEVRGLAQKIGAINTIINENGALIGYNTDAHGFYQNLESAHIKSALIIGAGGSAKAAACILREKNIKVCITNRSENNFASLREAGFFCVLNNELDLLISQDSQFDLIVNATSSSINSELPMARTTLEALFLRAKIAFDLMYGRELPFLELAKKYNLQTIDGAKMLLYQGILASSLFLNLPCEKIAPIMKEAHEFA